MSASLYCPLDQEIIQVQATLQLLLFMGMLINDVGIIFR